VVVLHGLLWVVARDIVNLVWLLTFVNLPAAVVAAAVTAPMGGGGYTLVAVVVSTVMWFVAGAGAGWVISAVLGGARRSPGAGLRSSLAVGIGLLLPFVVLLVVEIWPFGVSSELRESAARQSVEVRVVGLDDGEPVAAAGVSIKAYYPYYYPGFMANAVGGERCYWLRTDESGVAEIPLSHYLISEWEHHKRRPAALPARYELCGWRVDHTAACADLVPGDGPAHSATLTIADESENDVREGSFGHAYGYEDGAFNSLTRFAYRIDPVAGAVVRADSEETADFVVIYRIIPFTGGRYDDCRPTDRPDTCKVLSRIETFDRGGVAVDPTTPRRFTTFGEVSGLSYEREQSLVGDYEIRFVRSRDGSEYAALGIGESSMKWMVHPTRSTFFRGRSGRDREEQALRAPRAGPFACRPFDPEAPPDPGEWRREREGKPTALDELAAFAKENAPEPQQVAVAAPPVVVEERVVLPVPPEPTPPESARFREAHALIEAGDCGAALELLERNIAEFPDAPRIDYSYAWAATCAARLGKLDRALELYEVVATRFAGEQYNDDGGPHRTWDRRLASVREEVAASGLPGADEVVRQMGEF